MPKPVLTLGLHVSQTLNWLFLKKKEPCEKLGFKFHMQVSSNTTGIFEYNRCRDRRIQQMQGSSNTTDARIFEFKIRVILERPDEHPDVFDIFNVELLNLVRL